MVFQLPVFPVISSESNLLIAKLLYKRHYTDIQSIKHLFKLLV